MIASVAGLSTKLRGFVIKFASTHQTENPRGFSEVGENKQLLIATVRQCYYSYSLNSNDKLSKLS